MAKSRSNGAQVQKLVERKPIVEYLLSSGGMYVYTVVFSIFGVIFIIDAIPGWAKILLGIVFLAPVIILNFHRGKTSGEKAYKLKNKTILSDIHSQKITYVNPFVSILHTLPYFLSAILLTVLGVAAKQQWLQGIMQLLFIPSTLIFMGSGIMQLGTLTWFSVLSVGIFAFLVSAAFVSGYFLSIAMLKNRASELVNEIRSYE